MWGWTSSSEQWICSLLLISMLIAAQGADAAPGAGAVLAFVGPDPGVARAGLEGGAVVLENDAIRAEWQLDKGRLRPRRLGDKLSGSTLELSGGQAFGLTFSDGTELWAADLRTVQGPTLEDLPAEAQASNLARRSPGKQVTLQLASEDGRLRATWNGILRDGSSYVRQRVTFTAADTFPDVEDVVLTALPVEGARSVGTVAGVPAVAEPFFFGLEHPRSLNETGPRAVRCYLPRNLPLAAGDTIEHTSVVGIAVAGQLRRSFQYYVNRERAHPFRFFLHYNTWYDLRELNEQNLLERIDLIGTELVSKRGVDLAAFVFDDGWDDPKTLWEFNAGFPDGFAPHRTAAANYHSNIGVWQSPFGGYGESRLQRLNYGAGQGFETNDKGLSLAGPHYYERFKASCLRMLDEFDVNYFKFDGVGYGLSADGSSRDRALDQDVEALLRLIGELRDRRPDLFVNITVGAWPSPFWLWHGDSLWRGDEDMNLVGEGPERERWISYRDHVAYESVVGRSPLFPLNSLMYHGFCNGRYGLSKDFAPNLAAIKHDLRIYFSSGADLQELYITPTADYLSSKAWDAIAEAARWSHANADVLIDSHWVGGDPAQGDIYGFAAWSPRKGTLSLRRPSHSPGTITLDIADVFELPEGAPTRYALTSPWSEDAGRNAIVVEAGKPHTFKVEPFEVRVFDAVPVLQTGAR
jgi:hypothetical protein